jgi:hypothetical protein
MVMAALLAFLLGTMIGLLARPLLDAYLSWKTAEFYRHADEDEAAGSDRGTGTVERPR